VKRIYIAGPMTGLPELNFPAFHAAAADLRAQNYDVVNPAEICPDPAPWEECMKRDLVQMLTCDGAHFLPGWEKSRGATLEFVIASQLGFDISFATPRPVACELAGRAA
jgi:hypothetical protein